MRAFLSILRVFLRGGPPHARSTLVLSLCQIFFCQRKLNEDWLNSVRQPRADVLYSETLVSVSSYNHICHNDIWQPLVRISLIDNLPLELQESTDGRLSKPRGTSKNPDWTPLHDARRFFKHFLTEAHLFF